MALYGLNVLMREVQLGRSPAESKQIEHLLKSALEKTLEGSGAEGLLSHSEGRVTISKRIIDEPDELGGQFTVAGVARKMKKSPAAVRRALSQLLASGQVKVVGHTDTQKRGRPAAIYALA